MRPRTARRLAPNQVSELVTASRDGVLTVIYETSELIEAPNWAGDGTLVYNADGRLWRISADGRKGPSRIDTTPIEDLNNDHVLSPDGTWIYVSANDGHLYRVPATGGGPEKISPDQDPARGYRYYLHGISPDGTELAYVGLETGAGVVTRICTLGLDGTVRELTDGACPVDGPDYAPDGALWFNSEAAATRPGHAQIFRLGESLTQITHDERVNWFPHVSPDGGLVAYISFPPGTLGHPADKDVIIRVMAPDGSGIRDIDRFNGGQGTINVGSWAPDGSAFAYVRYPFR